MGKCVLINDQISDVLKEWLDAPAEHGGSGSRCDHIVEVAKRAQACADYVNKSNDIDWSPTIENVPTTRAAGQARGGGLRHNIAKADTGGYLTTLEDKRALVKNAFAKMEALGHVVVSGTALDPAAKNPFPGGLTEIMAFADQMPEADREDAGVWSALNAVANLNARLAEVMGNDYQLGTPQYAVIHNASLQTKEHLFTLKDDVIVLQQYQIDWSKANDGANNAIESEMDKLNARQKACEEQKSADFTGTKCGEGSDKSEGCVDPEQWNCLSEEELARLAKLKQERDANLEGLDNLGSVVAATQEPTKRTFKEQCLLLSHLDKFLNYRYEQYKTGGASKRMPYIAAASGGASTNIPGAGDVQVPAAPINENACIMAQREPWGFMNQLTQDPSYSTFFDIEPQYLSQLQPTIRLYKVSSFAGGEEKEIEVEFDTVYNPKVDGVLKSTKKRGFGVGIKNFQFSYEGSDPFSVKKSIKAKLSIFASSMDDLLTIRGSGATKYRYADLALKTGSPITATQQAWDPELKNQLEKLNFRLKAVVGWAVPPGFGGATDSKRKEIYKACYNSYVTLQLTPTIHEFEIDEMGQVVFHVNYLAYVEEFFDQTSYNVFTNPDLAVSAIQRKAQLDALAKSCSSGAQDKLKEEKEKIAEEVDEEKRTVLKSMLEGLMNRKQIYYISLPYDALRGFNSSGPYWSFELGAPIVVADKAQSESVSADVDEIIESQENPEEEKKPPGSPADLSETKVDEINMKEFVAFFYLNDLIDITLENIGKSLNKLKSDISNSERPPDVKSAVWNKLIKSEKERLERVYANFTKFRCVLGPVEFRTESDGQFHVVNLGDLPISTAYFMDWLTDKTLKRDNVMYSMPIFLKDLLNNLVKNFLNEDLCFDLNIKQRIRVFQSTVTSYKNPQWSSGQNVDEMTEWMRKGYISNKSKLDMEKMALEHRGGDRTHGGRAKWPVLHVMGERGMPINSRGFDNTYNYMVFYAGRVQPQNLMSGDATKDRNAGIFHYVLGKPRGIIKTIKLNKTDAPGLKEVRFEQEGFDGLQQLREVYDASITCYATPNTVPGTYIYVDPRGFAPNTAHFKNIKDSEGNIIDNASLTRLGIGGYFMVIRAESNFGPGHSETEITAKWVAQLANQRAPNVGVMGKSGKRGPNCKDG